MARPDISAGVYPGKAYAVDPFIEGYRRFHEHVWPRERARYEALAEQGE